VQLCKMMTNALTQKKTLHFKIPLGELINSKIPMKELEAA